MGRRKRLLFLCWSLLRQCEWRLAESSKKRTVQRRFGKCCVCILAGEPARSCQTCWFGRHFLNRPNKSSARPKWMGQRYTFGVITNILIVLVNIYCFILSHFVSFCFILYQLCRIVRSFCTPHTCAHLRTPAHTCAHTLLKIYFLWLIKVVSYILSLTKSNQDEHEQNRHKFPRVDLFARLQYRQ